MKKKIIFCTKNLDIGGIERAAINYVNHLDKSKYEVYLYLSKKEGIYQDAINKDIKILNFNIAEDKNILIRKIKNAFKLLYFTIKYYHKFDFAADFATPIKNCGILAKRFSKNNAIWFHGPYWTNPEEANKFLKYVNADKYQKVVFVSHYLKNLYQEARPHTTQKLYVINNPINYQEMIEKSNAKLEIKKTKTTILNVGRHEEQSKKLSLLLSVTQKLLKEKYDFELWLVGDGEDNQMYKDMVNKLKINNNVKFFGKQSNVFPYYKQCDAIILTSAYEGNPVVYLEGKVLNKPIISTDISDAKIELSGYGIVTSRSEEDIYRGLKEFLDNGYQIKKPFDPEKYNKEIFDKLKKVIEE